MKAGIVRPSGFDFGPDLRPLTLSKTRQRRVEAGTGRIRANMESLRP